jgi:hypothetical protein
VLFLKTVFIIAKGYKLEPNNNNKKMHKPKVGIFKYEMSVLLGDAFSS